MTRKIQKNRKKRTKTVKRRRTGGEDTLQEREPEPMLSVETLSDMFWDEDYQGAIDAINAGSSTDDTRGSIDYNKLLNELLQTIRESNTLDNDSLADTKVKELFDLILSKISDINWVTSLGVNALHDIVSIETGSLLYYLKELVKKGINVNKKTLGGRGGTAIHFLSFLFGSNKMENETINGIFEHIGDIRESVQWRDDDGFTPLHHLIVNIGDGTDGGKPYYMDDDRWTNFVQHLIKNGADINEIDEAGEYNTPLMQAAERVDLVRVKGLIEKFNADITLTDSGDRTAFDKVDIGLRQAPRFHAGKTQEYVDEIKNLLRGQELRGESSGYTPVLSKTYNRPEKVYEVDTCVPGTFNDLIMLEETEYTNVNKFLEDDSNNIVIQYFINDKPKMFLTTRDNITQMHKQKEHLFYGCEKEDSWGSYKRDFVFFDLKSIGLISSHPLCVFDAYFREEPQQIYSLHFEKNDIIDKFKTYSSVAAANGGNVVSGWHCQTGATGKYCWLALGKAKSLECSTSGGKRNKRRTKTIKKRNKNSKRNAKKRTYRRKKR
jgi:hypothetical protein